MRNILLAIVAMFSITADAAIIEYDFDSAGGFDSALTGGPTSAEVTYKDGLTVTAGPGTLFGPAKVHHDTSPAGGGLGVYSFFDFDDSLDGRGLNEYLTFEFNEVVELASMSFNDGDHDKIFNGEMFNFFIDGYQIGSDVLLQASASTLGYGLTGSSFTIQNVTGTRGNGFYVAGLSVNTDTDISTSSVDVPEPGSLALMGLGLAGLAGMRRRKQA